MRHGIKLMGFERGNSERLAVKEWHGSAEPPKSDEGEDRRAKLARATPRSNPKSEGTKKARVWSVCWYLRLLCLSCRALTLYFLRKEGGSRAET